ncbi:CbtA family protein [Pseudomonas sp. KU43P]|uniref:CbtA family protein n=1 Tax=Pseudomonas sp. KU43P TaxID=2487887 RepID=UPI0012A916E1|nr:CbtA family protein [Pseudomonas sp. KU43P]BBH48792.1 membrane protein [Pseudomonas sp. KU43P]
MTGNLLLRGMLAGLLAGILAFGFAKVFGEPSVDQAIAFEETLAHSHDHGDGAADEEEELVSCEVQSTVGLFTGVVIYSVSIGGIFALVFAFAMGRMGSLKVGPRGLAAILAVLAFISVILVPGLKYPANPPSVGDPETIGQRTKLFFLMMVVSIAALVVAVNLFRKLLARHGGWAAAVAAIVLYVVIMAVAGKLFPAINEVPKEFSASLLWNFRIASLGIHVVLWAVLGLVFGWLAQGPVLAPRNRHNARLQS